MKPNQSLQSSNSKKKTSTRTTLGFNILLKALSGSWLVWCGLWILLIAIAYTAAFSITNTGFEQHSESNTTQIAGKKSEQSHIWWLLGTALIFATASIVLGRQFNRLGSRRLSTAQLTSRQKRRQRLKERINLVESLPSEFGKPIEVILPLPNPPDISESESLAEMMDIRKYRSLDSILHE